MLREWLFLKGVKVALYFGHPLGRAISLLRESQYWSADELSQHQGQALNALMHHCYNHVPYYRDLMSKRNLRPDDFQSASDLAKLPYLTRDIISEHSTHLRADNYPDAVCQFRRSGGTTGEPVRVAIDARARAFEVAAFLRGLDWMNYKMGRPLVRLFGGTLGFYEKRTLKTKAKDWLLNTRSLPAFELTPRNVKDYLDVIYEAEKGVLVGYASATFNLAEYMSLHQFRGTPLSSIICTAEHMPNEWRVRIQERLTAPVFCYYGCGEINSLAYECAREEGYLVSQEHVILEIANADPTQFRDEGRGEACITTLFNYAMPLIRYLNGDLVTLEYPQRGRAHLRIAQLDGRVMDQLLSKNGYRVSSVLPSHLIFKSGVPVCRYQVVQTDYDALTFRYLLPDGSALSAEIKDKLATAFKTYLGADVRLQFAVGDFEITTTGKHRIVVNKLNQTTAVAQ